MGQLDRTRIRGSDHRPLSDSSAFFFLPLPKKGEVSAIPSMNMSLWFSGSLSRLTTPLKTILHVAEEEEVATAYLDEPWEETCLINSGE